VAQDSENYVFKVRDNTRRYVDQLLGEIRKLRALLTSLEDETVHVEQEISAAHSEIGRYQVEREKLKLQLQQIKKENRQFAEQFEEVERQNNNLAHLYVASYRLHETLDREEVISVIQEIVIDLIGSEETAIFEVNEQGGLDLVASIGMDVDRLEPITLAPGHIGRSIGTIKKVAATGERYVADGKSDGASDLTACLPLKVDGRVTGVIAVFRLLNQKPGLKALDYELFDLLATHAAIALYCSKREAPPPA
jgi:nitrate/nitrite-specific signal transduction histidine kinase